MTENSKVRAAEYYELYKELGTLNAVGERVGLTRERVRQILSEHGYKTLHKKLSDEERKRRNYECARRWQKANREKVVAGQLRWQKANREKTRAYCKGYYDKKMAEPGGLAAHAKRIADWRSNNLEHARKREKIWHEANRDKCRGYSRKYYLKKKAERETV